MDILKKFMTKEVLAAVLELTGQIPEPGEAYSSNKEGNQMETPVREVQTDGMEKEITVTGLTIDG